ncbi:PEP-CTERM sorting domain-containing protein [Synoicihabitans lomoniglobus]|uniref:PEP-CTERM sorting domain-containing protein n=1 Tax=Synoicihabitans lomoniglobus TaxID=2909285 RepID=A0AAE9ZXY4_9BACT|nr:PEP-CTERM sorting domain-containing protein [Opitutaceae bacterium LMO-M01]WED64613.1 PEP-CTERM sorting domain-containing protein [Opitutaceae bacterium LMO-M01]
MELTFDWQFNQTYGLQFRAYESDASGNLGASLVTGTTFSTSLESDVADDAEVFNFFGGYNTNEGISHLDNFATTSVSVSAVPEPSTYAALLGFAALGLAGGRRGRLTRA